MGVSFREAFCLNFFFGVNFSEFSSFHFGLECMVYVERERVRIRGKEVWGGEKKT